MPIKIVSSDIQDIVSREWTWDEIVECLKIPVKRKSSGVLVCLCIFHKERTPSMWLRPNGSFNCYGCESHGEMIDFLDYILDLDAESGLRLRLMSLRSLRDNPNQLHFPFGESQDCCFKTQS